MFVTVHLGNRNFARVYYLGVYPRIVRLHNTNNIQKNRFVFNFITSWNNSPNVDESTVSKQSVILIRYKQYLIKITDRQRRRVRWRLTTFEWCQLTIEWCLMTYESCLMTYECCLVTIGSCLITLDCCLMTIEWCLMTIKWCLMTIEWILMTTELYVMTIE